MEVVGGVKYKHKKEDCPYVLSLALRKKYLSIPKLGCMMSNNILMNKLKKGLHKYNLDLNTIYKSSKHILDYIDKKQLKKILLHLLKNKKDGFFVLEHNNPKETRHLFSFLYNYKYNTLDFFDSYNDTRTFYTLRMKKNIDKFIDDVFHKYFKDEFVIEYCYEFNEIR